MSRAVETDAEAIPRLSKPGYVYRLSLVEQTANLEIKWQPGGLGPEFDDESQLGKLGPPVKGYERPVQGGGK